MVRETVWSNWIYRLTVELRNNRPAAEGRPQTRSASLATLSALQNPLRRLGSAFEDANHTHEPTNPALNIHPSGSLNSTVAALSLRPEDVPNCPGCQESRLRPGVCWFGEKLPQAELSRFENWFRDAENVDLVLVIGTERTPFVDEAIAKGAEVAWLNVIDSELIDVGDDWYVSGCVTETLTQLVDVALR